MFNRKNVILIWKQGPRKGGRYCIMKNPKMYTTFGFFLTSRRNIKTQCFPCESSLWSVAKPHISAYIQPNAFLKHVFGDEMHARFWIMHARFQTDAREILCHAREKTTLGEFLVQNPEKIFLKKVKEKLFFGIFSAKLQEANFT